MFTRRQILTLIFQDLRRKIKSRLAEAARALVRKEGHNDLHETEPILDLVRMKFDEDKVIKIEVEKSRPRKLKSHK